ncbi:MAG: type II secretion system protein N [bacterium]
MSFLFRILLFLATVLVTVTYNFPLRTALVWSGLPTSGLYWHQVTGSVWRGQIKGLATEKVNIATISWHGDPLALLSAAFEGQAQSRGTISGQAKLRFGLDHKIIVQNLDMQTDLRLFELRDIFNSQMRGQAHIQSERLLLTEAECLDGNFTFSTNALVHSAQHYGGTAGPLTGQGQCEDGQITAKLSATGPDADILIDLTVNKNWDYTARVVVNTNNDRLGAGLLVYGFEAGKDGFALLQRGNFMQEAGQRR